jgi:hypothetical protein
MLRPVEREMKRDSWSLFLFFVAMTKHNEEKKKSDRFVCIDNASMCIQSSDQVSSFEIRVVKLFLDLYKQMKRKKIFTNPDNFIFVLEKKRRRKEEEEEEDTLMFKVQKLLLYFTR